MSDPNSTNLALSTVWASSQAVDSAHLLALLDQTGFSRLELEYRLSVPVLAELRQGLKARGWQVGSVHNFCPLPQEMPGAKASGDLFNLASPDKEERLTAVNYTTRTLELAADLEARTVVLHLGWLEELTDRALTPQAARQGGLTPELEAAWQKRQQASPRLLDAISFALDRLLPRAGQLGVSLGLENRFHHFQAPSLEEAQALFQRFAGAPLGYWHDTGHAHNLGLAGITPELAWLESLGGQLLGCHLHDANGPADHLPPGAGELDWDALCPWLAQAPVKVMELRPGPSAREVAQAGAWLEHKLALAAEAARAEHASQTSPSQGDNRP